MPKPTIHDLTRNTTLRLEHFNVKSMRCTHTFWRPLLSVRLHGDVRIQVVQCSIRFFTPMPAALVHSFNLFVSSARALVLLSARNRYEGIDLSSLIRMPLAIRNFKRQRKLGQRTWPRPGPAVAPAPPAETPVPGELYGPGKC